MKLRELIEQLESLSDETNDEKEVYFAYPSGDYWGRVIAKKIGAVEELPIEYSAYHRENILSKEPDYNDDSEVEETGENRELALIVSAGSIIW